MTTVDGRADERCELTELIKAQCAHCLGLPGPAAELLRELFEDPAGPAPGPRWFRASYEGRCAECGDPFEAGEYITQSGRGYIAECCGEPGP